MRCVRNIILVFLLVFVVGFSFLGCGRYQPSGEKRENGFFKNIDSLAFYDSAAGVVLPNGNVFLIDTLNGIPGFLKKRNNVSAGIFNPKDEQFTPILMGPLNHYPVPYKDEKIFLIGFPKSYLFDIKKIPGKS